MTRRKKELRELIRFPGDGLARLGLRDCERCGGLVLLGGPNSPPGLPPRDENGCVQCWACALGEPNRRVEPRGFLGIPSAEDLRLRAIAGKRQAPRLKCRDCGQALPPERRRPGRCEKCRRKRRRKTWRESKRRGK